ncbi:glycerophosphodiester phosphodiesterase [Paenibacillus sp. EC2-1]|uniref:glycerophosphodiester phosphodiesterase n=1 Tax=Paenibacillus sp. EC2-1 TaxID=3388665 RepID=UPI003BEF4269
MRVELRLAVVIGVLLTLILGSTYTSLEQLVSKVWLPETSDVLRIAHRGASGYAPENTMAAFEQAYKMGADMLELDVQLSNDGQVVVFHDTRLNRTSSGRGTVQNMTLHQLRQLDAGSWYNSRFRGQKIPTLDDILQYFGGKIPLLIELKSSTQNSGIEQKTAEIIQKYNQELSLNLQNQIIIQSFNITSLRLFHELLPEVPLAVLTSNSYELRDERLYELARFAQVLSISRPLVTEEKVQRVHDAGMKVFVWNVRHLFDIPSLLHAKVDGIITDYPDMLPTRQGESTAKLEDD